MAKKLNADQKIVMRIAKEELFRGNRVTISAKKFGHPRKFKDEVDVVGSPYPLEEVKKDAEKNTAFNGTGRLDDAIGGTGTAGAT